MSGIEEQIREKREIKEQEEARERAIGLFFTLLPTPHIFFVLFIFAPSLSFHFVLLFLCSTFPPLIPYHSLLHHLHHLQRKNCKT